MNWKKEGTIGLKKKTGIRMSVLVEKANLSLKYIAHYNEVKELLFEGSSDVINAARKKAFQDFVLQGIPSRKNENYKYTNLHPRFLPDYKFVHQRENNVVDTDTVFRCDVPQLDTDRQLIFNGWFHKNDNGPLALPKGVILCSLEEIARKNPVLLQRYYTQIAKTDADPMVALNTAFAKDGYFVYIPKNIILKKPIQIINFLQANNSTFVTQRNLIVIEAGAGAQLIMCDHTLNQNQYLNNSLTEIYVGENANFDYYTLQNQHNKTTGINSVFIQQERDSALTAHTTTLHGGLIRNNLNIVMNGENAEANIFGMAFIDKKQHIDNSTLIVHAKPHCRSNQVYKYVLGDESTGAFSGQIHVARDAQKTNAFQRNNNLLLTDQATMQTKPQLIINADDVKCSHGATVGQIDEEALFYLRSRGIDEDKARLMMMNAFAHEVVQEIKVEALRNRIDGLVEKRLNGEVARCHECNYNCES
ncbi:MAG: Fe-S cluster assembly protein SufD [Draconibacterium sp.]|nr:Fe-S cluster assembly protein SufD [Draconibacterium sp.]